MKALTPLPRTATYLICDASCLTVIILLIMYAEP